MQIKAKQDFSWAHGGCVVEAFAADQVIDTDDAELVRVACDEGWAEIVAAGDSSDGGEGSDDPGGKEPSASGKASSTKALPGAPENK